jgi:hypothetical protein
MTSLYEVLKASKTQQFPDYWTLLWGRKLSASMIKTITGTLPLTFTAKGGNAVDWTISGNAEGVGERTKNIVDISSFNNIDQNNVVMILNDDNATVSVYTTDTPTAQMQGLCNFMVEKTGNYFLSGVPEIAPNTSLNIYIWNRDTNSRAKAWDKVTDMANCNKNSQSVEVYLEQDVRYQLRVRVQTSYGKYEEPVIVSPMIRFDGTTDTFIPFGYQIPIAVSQDGESDKSYEIFIGDAPLGEGETVSKTSTGIDIELFEGSNSLSTTLTNKPEMTIKYK